MKSKIYICLISSFFFANIALPQYFGQTKPAYKQFDFSLYTTEHFDIYHYFSNDSLLNQFAIDAEKWYLYHQQILQDTFHVRNPILLYSSHADFQQTTAVMGSVDIGTGGITEGLKRRVVLPVTFTKHQTDHVLGHELVHAFQYHLMVHDPELGLQAIKNVPLWMIEGMAEYLSVGSIDSQTAMWMKDALLNNYFPTLEQMSRDYRLSPYRFGQAFWSYVASVYGEQYIPRLFKATAQMGFELSVEKVLSISADSLSIRWKKALTNQLITDRSDTVLAVLGKRLLNEQNSGIYNLSPVISPDGKYLIFLSERDFYGLDLFLADMKSGKIIKKVFTSTKFDEVDALNFIETSGSWSPDSKNFVYVAYIKGQSVLMILEVDKKGDQTSIVIEGMDAVNNPSWSPNGKSILFSGLKNGVSDIYQYHFDSGITTNLTHSNYSCIQPSWSPDGQSIFFVSDQSAMGQNKQHVGSYNIVRYCFADDKCQVIPTFSGAENMNPTMGSDANWLYFLSNYDGARNIYQLNITNDSIYQLTNYPTGVTGITPYSPALSISGNLVCYSLLWNNKFEIVAVDMDSINSLRKSAVSGQYFAIKSRLMPYSNNVSKVESNLSFQNMPKPEIKKSFRKDKITSRFKLDYIGNMSGGVMTGRFGTGIAGSVEALFSDMLGHHMLYSALSINGEIYDFGGQVAYMNQKRPLKYGASLSHIPYRSGYFDYAKDTLGDGTIKQTSYFIFRRIFEEKASLFAYYPFNRTRRVEFGVSGVAYSYKSERYNDYSAFNNYYQNKGERMKNEPGFIVGILDLAYVIDNSRFGLVSPVAGKRMRFQLEEYVYQLSMHTLLLDIRQYVQIRPYSLAFRLYHYGRYGAQAESKKLTRLFLGYPWYVRGYETGNFYNNVKSDESTISYQQMLGSKMVVGNFEFRIPFTGPSKIAHIKSELFFSELALFIDGGVIWDSDSSPTFSLQSHSNEKRIPIFSTGVGLRVNLLGAIVIEPYYAFPFFQSNFQQGQLGINIFSGW